MDSVFGVFVIYICNNYFHPAKFGGVTRNSVNCCQIWCGLPYLVDSPFFFQNSFMGCPWAFPSCHMEAPDWAMWQPLIGPHYPLPSYHATLVRHINMPHQPYRLYGLPHGMILLVHRSVQKANNRVTCGFLWCCHISMTCVSSMLLPCVLYK